MIQFSKAWLLPGSVQSLLLGTSLAALLLFPRRTSVLARRLFVGVVAVHLLMSLPAFADALAVLARGRFQPVTVGEVQDAGAVVVLDGGSRRITLGDISFATATTTTALRAAEAVRVYRLLRPGSWIVIMSGTYDAEDRPLEGRALRDLLITSGIASDKILVDDASRNTREHATQLPLVLQRIQVSRFVLVTSATHMPRALRAIRAVGSAAMPSPAPMWVASQIPAGLGRYIPDQAAMEVSRQAVYELAGSAYYWLRGWS